MKEKYFFWLFFCLYFVPMSLFSFPKIMEKAPSSTTQHVSQGINFPEDYQGQWILLFSFPNIFSPVCTSEVVKFIQLSDQFKRANCVIIGVSNYSQSHYKIWLESIEKQNNLTIPNNLVLLSDTEQKIAKKYGLIHSQSHPQKYVRAVYIIDPKGYVKAVLFYPMLNGRNVQELYRLLMAIQASDTMKGGVTPENWQPGDEVPYCKPCSSKK